MKKPFWDLNQQLEDLMQQYNVNKSGEEYYDIILREIYNILEENCKNKLISIRGCGVHTGELLDIMNFPCEIEAIYDQRLVAEGKYGRNDKIYRVLPAEKIVDASAEVIVISSFRHRKIMKEEIDKMCFGIPTIDIYEELSLRGINLQEAFYYNAQHSYENILFSLKKYKSVEEESTKGKSLQNLIYYSLKIRDFINTFFYLDTYIERGYQNSAQYRGFRKDLKSFLKTIQKRIQRRKERDVIIVWNDQVGHEDLELFPYMRQTAEEGVDFCNAFTPVPFTYASFWGMFEKQYSIDDKIYFAKHNKIGAQNAILSMLREKGYIFRYIGDGPTAECFEQEYGKGYPSYDSSCVRCFDMLEELVNTDTKMCIMLHALVETHNPYLSAELEDSKWFEWPYTDVDIEAVKKQIQCSAQYWDRQLEFYMRFMNERSTKIFMSDHGKRYLAEPIYQDLANHILFIIQDKRLTERQEERLFTLTRLKEVLDYLTDETLNDEKYENLFSDAIKMQEVGIFNETAIRYYLGQKKYESFAPYRAARGEIDKYVLLSNGKELYFRLPDEENNKIDHPAYQDRIDQLRKTAGSEFVNRDKFETELKRFRKQYETH